MEIRVGSLRIENYDSNQNFILQQLELDFLDKKQCDL